MPSWRVLGLAPGCDASLSLGYTSQAGTYPWVLDPLETAFIGAYLAAVSSFGALGHADLAQLACRHEEGSRHDVNPSRAFRPPDLDLPFPGYDGSSVGTGSTLGKVKSARVCRNMDTMRKP